MGCAGTKQRPIFEDPSLLSSQTRFTVKEIESLKELFTKLGHSLVDDNFLDREEFKFGLLGDGKQRSLFGDRMFDMFDSKHDGVLDFGEFVTSLNIFHPDTPQQDKATFIFKLYDIWQTGYIEKEEVKEMVKEFLNESNMVLSHEIVEAIVDKTFEEVDSRKDGKIDMEEWKDFVARKPSSLTNMTIPYLRCLQKLLRLEKHLLLLNFQRSPVEK